MPGTGKRELKISIDLGDPAVLFGLVLFFSLLLAGGSVWYLVKGVGMLWESFKQ